MRINLGLTEAEFASRSRWMGRDNLIKRQHQAAQGMTTVRTRGALVAVGFLCGYLARQLRSPVRVRVNLEWNEESRSVRAVRRFTKLLGGGVEA